MNISRPTVLLDPYRQFKKSIVAVVNQCYIDEKFLTDYIVFGKATKILECIYKYIQKNRQEDYYLLLVGGIIIGIINQKGLRCNKLFCRLNEYSKITYPYTFLNSWLAKKAIGCNHSITLFVTTPHSPKCLYLLRKKNYLMYYNSWTSIQFLHKRKDDYRIIKLFKIQYELTSTIIEKISLKSIMRLSLYFV